MGVGAAVGVDVGIGVGAGPGQAAKKSTINRKAWSEVRRLSTPHCGMFGAQGNTGCGAPRPMPSISPLASD